MGCSDILTNESCQNQLSILQELNSFRDYLQNFDYDSVIEELQNRLVDNHEFIFGGEPLSSNFSTLKGIQDYVRGLEFRIDNIISGTSGAINWDELIHDGEVILDKDVIKNSTSIIDAIIKINNYLNTVQDLLNVVSLSVDEDNERIIINQSVGTSKGSVPVSATIDDGVGDPNVQLETINGTVNFNFHNLKGNGIENIEGTTSAEDSGINKYFITLSNGDVKTLEIRNGSKGEAGDSAVYNPDDPDTPDFVMANTLGTSTTKAITQKTITNEINAINKIVTNKVDVIWTTGRYMHPGNDPSIIMSDSVTRISAPIPVNTGDRIRVGTYELLEHTFTVIAFLQAENQVDNWSKKVGINDYGQDTFHTVSWTANADGYVVVSGVAEGMTLEIIPTTAKLTVLQEDVDNLKERAKGFFDNWTWNVGNLHPNNAAVKPDKTWQRYSSFVTMNKGDKLVVRTYYNTNGTYTIIARQDTGKIHSTTSQDTPGTYLTKIYTSPEDNIKVRVCVYVGDGTQDYPIKDDYSAVIYRANASVTRQDFENSMDTETILPDYWKEYLPERVTTIKNNITSVGVDSFIFITDTHPVENNNRSALVIDYLLKNTPVCKTIFGGDVCATGTITTPYQNRLVKGMKKQEVIANAAKKRGWYLPIRGNHDFFENSTTVYGENLTETTAYLKSQVEAFGIKFGDNSTGCYYYLDNPESKIRFILIDTECGSPGGRLRLTKVQLAWIIDTIANSPYDVIIIGHVPATNRFSTSDESSDDALECLRNVILAANNKQGPSNVAYTSRDDSEQKGDAVPYDFHLWSKKVLFYLNGHNHCDNQSYHNGIPFITTMCDKSDNHEFSPFCENTILHTNYKPKNDPGEQAMDVVIIPSNHNTVIMRRVGFGFDRIFHIGEVKLSVGETRELTSSILTANSWTASNCDVGQVVSGVWPTPEISYASVSNGVVEALAPGEAFVFAEDANHNKEFWAVTVE